MTDFVLPPSPPPPFGTEAFQIYRQGFREGYQTGYQDGLRATPSALAPAASLPSAAPTPLEASPPPFVPPLEWIPLRHIGNGAPDAPPGCGEISHYLVQKITPQTPADPALLRTNRGATIQPTDVPRCGACGASINPWSAQYLDYRAAMLPVSLEQPERSTPASASDPAADLVKQLLALERQTMASSQPPLPRRICGLCGAATHPGRTCYDAESRTPSEATHERVRESNSA